jgi:hypothetical protein
MCRKKSQKKAKTAIFFKKVKQDLKSQKNAKKCQTTSKMPNSPKFGLEKRYLATLTSTQSHSQLVVDRIRGLELKSSSLLPIFDRERKGSRRWLGLKLLKNADTGH